MPRCGPCPSSAPPSGRGVVAILFRNSSCLNLPLAARVLSTSCLTGRLWPMPLPGLVWLRSRFIRAFAGVFPRMMLSVLNFGVVALRSVCSRLTVGPLLTSWGLLLSPAKVSIAASVPACRPMMLCADPSAPPSFITSKGPLPSWWRAFSVVPGERAKPAPQGSPSTAPIAVLPDLTGGPPSQMGGVGAVPRRAGGPRCRCYAVPPPRLALPPSLGP